MNRIICSGQWNSAMGKVGLSMNACDNKPVQVFAYGSIWLAASFKLLGKFSTSNDPSKVHSHYDGESGVLMMNIEGLWNGQPAELTLTVQNAKDTPHGGLSWSVVAGDRVIVETTGAQTYGSCFVEAT